MPLPGGWADGLCISSCVKGTFQSLSSVTRGSEAEPCCRNELGLLGSDLGQAALIWRQDQEVFEMLDVNMMADWLQMGGQK